MDVLFLVKAFKQLAPLSSRARIVLAFQLALLFAHDEFALSFFLIEPVCLKGKDLVLQFLNGVFVLTAQSFQKIRHVVQIGQIIG